MKLKFFFLLFFSLYIVNCTLPIEAQATIRYVSKTGTSTPPYTSWETAADSIQKCINICNFGDTIYVANGNYKELIIMVPGLSLIGAGMDSCIIDMTDRTTYVNAVTMKDSCLIKGFNIKFSRLLPWIRGLGIYMRFQDTVKGCTVIYNRIDYPDMGMAITDGVIKKNIVKHATFGINCRIFDEVNEYHTLIDSNYISFYFIGLYPSNRTIINATGNTFLLESQFETEGEVLYNDILSGSLNPELNNNNIGKNTNDIIYKKAIISFFPGKFTNNQFIAQFENVFYTAPSNIKNNNIIGSVNGVYGDTTNVKYNNFWKTQNYPHDSTNISADPMFVNDTSDYHLQEFSPLIDSGDPNINDKDGSRSDIGLYGGPFGESYKYQDLPPRIPINFTATVDSPEVKLSWNKNTESDFRYYRLYRDTIADFTISTANLVSDLLDTFYIQQFPQWDKNYYYKVTAVDNQANESEPSAEVFINITSIDDYPQLITDYQLYQNYPNPFNPSTKIGYRLKKRGYVKLYVYDITGSTVGLLVNDEKEAGYYEAEFNVGNGLLSVPDLASGIYLYKIDITDSEKRIPVFTEIRKMLLIK
jgi:hypothetical protein